MTISRAELLTFRGGTLPDLVGPSTRLLFVGINPGLLTVAVQAHFAKRGNRFYPALYRAGITDRVIDAADGFRPEDRAYLLERGLGITSIVPSATARADELTRDELIAGGSALRERVERHPTRRRRRARHHRVPRRFRPTGCAGRQAGRDLG